MLFEENPVTVSAGTKQSGSVDQVAAQLVALITIGEFTPGEQMRQEDLAIRLQVSRVPVREALHALSELGLLMHERHRGFFVAKRTRSELTQLAWLLGTLESELIATLETPSAAQVAELRALNKKMTDIAIGSDWVELIEMNREFHFAIFNLSPLTLVTREVARLWRLAAPYIVFDLARESDRLQTVAEHEELIKALVSGDRAQLEKMLNDHRSKNGLVISAQTSRGA
jgi:DNA-binding GntR family transcriptional regulator